MTYARRRDELDRAERRSCLRWTRVRTCWNVEEAGCELGRDWIGGSVVVVVVYETPWGV